MYNAFLQHSYRYMKILALSKLQQFLEETAVPKADTVNELKHLFHTIKPLSMVLDSEETVRHSILEADALLMAGVFDKEKLMPYFRSAVRDFSRPESLFGDSVKLSSLLRAFGGFVREISRMSSKHVELYVPRNSFCVNKKAAAALFVIFTNTIYNSIIHGIEPPIERALLSKTKISQIKFDIFEKKEYLYIVQTDDGRGFDFSQIPVERKSFYSGQGMKSIFMEVQKMQGKIEIQAKRGSCTIIKIKLKKDIINAG